MLWYSTQPEAGPSIWENMQSMQEAEPLQSVKPGIQEMNMSMTSTLQQPRHVHEMHNEEDVTAPNEEESNKSFDSMSMKSLIFSSKKS